MVNWNWYSKVTLFGAISTTALAGILLFRVDTNSQDSTPNLSSTSDTPIVSSVSPVPIEEKEFQRFSFAETPKETQPVSSPNFNLNESLSIYSPLFETPVSLGMLAIGAAEGTYRVFAKEGTLYVQQTSAYFGHTDPGNLSWGEVVTNYGPCSDQGRSKGDITQAEQWCVTRSRSQLPTHLQDLIQMGINPSQDLEAVLNTADLYNQASPIHSRKFPEALAIAKQGGLEGSEAIAWARTASFYINSNNELDLKTGKNKATGLMGICARQTPWVTQWECVYADQVRRVNAIADVINNYRQAGQNGR